MARNQNWHESEKDTVYEMIDKSYLTLSEEDRTMCEDHLYRVIYEILLPMMKQKDELFEILFERVVHGGSYNKGTKYDKPDEFDLNFVMDLGLTTNSRIMINFEEENHGFIQIKLNPNDFTNVWSYYRDTMYNWVSSDNLLNSYNFRNWIKSVLISALGEFKEKDNNYIIRCEESFRTYKIKFQESGPAFTLTISYGKIVIAVDIVPCFEFLFSESFEHNRKSLNGAQSYLMVPKPLDRCIDNRFSLWRLSYSQQEKSKLDDRVKSTIKMMKKLRDTKGWDSIASYYIETIFYHALENNKDNLDEFLDKPKTDLFMWGLVSLRDALKNKKLPYFWNEQHNLFDGLKIREFDKYTDQLSGVIDSINSKIFGDPFILAYHTLNEQEFKDLKGNCFTKILQYFGYKSSRNTFGLDWRDYCWQSYDKYKYGIIAMIVIFVVLCFKEEYEHYSKELEIEMQSIKTTEENR